ncbi:MAG: phosphate/phosphite/phosphonate ABC transporter substrate-binding protein [Thermodesulfovibrionales bacterium]
MLFFKLTGIFILFQVFLLIPHQALCRDNPKELNFGIYPYDNPSKIYQDFSPLLQYLYRTTGLKINLVIAPNYISNIRNIGEGKVDIAFMGPSPYIRANDRFGGVELLVRFVMKDERIDSMVIIAHKESDIKTINDLKGKSFAFGDHQSYGSHFYPRYLLNKAGVRLRDLKYYDYLSSHSRVVLAVSHKDFDAGGVREDIYEKYKDRPIKIIAGPFRIPPHVIVCRKGLSLNIKKRLKDALLSLKEPEVLNSIDPEFVGFSPVKDSDFSEARRVVNFVEDR